MPADLQDHKKIPVAIALGSNLGDRTKALDEAVALLTAATLEKVQVSSHQETVPVDCAPDAPPFLNAALIGVTRLSPVSLLDCCREIEQRLGRPRRRGFHDNRAIDIDILLYGDAMIRVPNLTIPHPAMMRRLFVLQPLSEIAGDWRVPPEMMTVADYLRGVIDGSPCHGHSA